jgi:hypothetical protein
MDKTISKDQSIILEADIDAHGVTNTFREILHIDFGKIYKRTSAILIFVNGDSRSFTSCASISGYCSRGEVHMDSKYIMDVDPTETSSTIFLECHTKLRKDVVGRSENMSKTNVYYSSLLFCTFLHF